MDRTQGWGGSPTHQGALYYAADWDNGSGHWAILAANGGTLRCNAEGDSYQEGLGNYVAIHNSVAGQTAIHAHLETCGFFMPDSPYAATQGQGIELASDSGRADGIHLHFHVINGSEYLGPHTTVPFSMSDRDSFTGTGSNGPSDNAGVAYNDPGSLDANIPATA